MRKIVINLSKSVWQSAICANSAELLVKGAPYLDMQQQTAQTMANDWPNDPHDTAILQPHLQRYNGFYSLVYSLPGQVIASVDRIRSFPLFYGVADSQFYLSDNAEWVRQQVGDDVTDPTAREEFQLVGYVTGQDTLFPHVKQLQAGQCLFATQGESGVDVRCYRYYRYLHTEPAEYDEQALLQQLDQVIVKTIRRLIDYAAGRQIVLPLSGGYDSRLIATQLKRLGYDKVLAFTYGVAGNKEAKYSKQVADALGFKWHFVEYSPELWHGTWEAAEGWEYQSWASGWSGIAHEQDWLAVKIMKQEQVVSADAVFVPGHVVVSRIGEHMPQKSFRKLILTQADTAAALYRKHYHQLIHTQADTAAESHEKFHHPATQSVPTHDHRFWQNRIAGRIADIGAADATHSTISFDGNYEAWEIQERQAKYIVNAVRAYEFFNYDWWLPLWDKDLMDFWQKLPFSLRKGREWYVNYAKAQYASQTEAERSTILDNAGDTPLRSAIGTAIRRLPPIFGEIHAALTKRTRVARITKRDASTLCQIGMFPQPETKWLLKNGYTTRGLLAHFFLESIKLNIEGRPVAPIGRGSMNFSKPANDEPATTLHDACVH